MPVNNYQQDEEKTKFSWTNLKRMTPYLKPFTKDLVFILLISIISSILLLLIPKLIQYAIDVPFVNKDFLKVIILTFFMLILIIISLILNKIRLDKESFILNKVSLNLKNDIFKKLEYLPNNYYDTKSHGKIYTRAATYPDEVAIILCYIMVEVLLDFLNLIFVLIFMFLTNATLSIIPVILASILIIFFAFLSPIRRKEKHLANDKNANINAFLSESLNGIRITQSFNREEKNNNILKKLENDRVHAVKKTLYTGNLTWSLTNILNYISKGSIYFIGLNYLYPTVSLGTILAIDSYCSRFWGPIEYLTESYNELMDAFTYLERIFELLDEPLIIENKKNALKIPLKGKIEFLNVAFSYDAKTPVLTNLNLSIKPGEKIGLVGETGSGKSTILNLISRFYDITSGKLLIDNTNIKDIDLSYLRRSISTMQQDSYLFARSVYDNLVLAQKISLKKVRAICKMLDIDDMIMHLEKGYDTILLNNGSNLSSGERQLLCIARIMIQNPKILILDEATSNIDLKTEKKIAASLNILTKDRTTIMVAHRLSTITSCDKIFLIKNHHVYEEGTHQELMQKKGEYYKLYNHQDS